MTVQLIPANQIYLEKRLKVLVPYLRSGKTVSPAVATVAKNFEALGYAFSPALFHTLARMNEAELTAFYQEVLPILKKMRGAHRRFKPMYPNFPAQVMNASDTELYFNAMIHYWSFFAKDLGLTNETWLPEYQKQERLPISEPVKLDMIDLGSRDDFKTIFTTLVSAKGSISDSDKAVLEWFVRVWRDKVVELLPETIPTKEQLAFIAGLLLKYTTSAATIVRYVKTPTDVLRVAVGFSGGDVSLAVVTKFRKFSRPERRFLLGLLEGCKTDLSEEMVKYGTRWQRLGELLHPGEYANQFPRSATAFKAIREGTAQSFAGKVEAALEVGVTDAMQLLVQRPGELARRLDHLFRSSPRKRATTAAQFLTVVDKVSTPVLLQVFTHFKTRGELDFRTVFPKGNAAKIQVLEGSVPVIGQEFCDEFADNVREILVDRFAKLGPLGKVYVDQSLKTYLVPFSQRSAAKALKTIVRGSKVDLDGDYDTVRFFIWWKNMAAGKAVDSWSGERVDIDLSASILDDKFNNIADVSYYNLRDFAGVHSGDITDAPNGAAEFIDISLNKVLQRGGRYIVMCINSFTYHKYCDLPECFAGWMGRQSAQSGEIFEAKTVKNKIDIASDTTIVLPLVIDAKERKVVWMDLGLKQCPTWNNVWNNQGGISLAVKAMTQLKKTTLFDLLSMHVEARGRFVNTPEKADVVFSPETIAFDTDTILTKYV